MKWKSPRHEEYRVVKKFALLPAYLSATSETIWLKFYYQIQEYLCYGYPSIEGWSIVKNCESKEETEKELELLKDKWLPY